MEQQPTLDDPVIDKGYADRRYLRSSGVGGVGGEIRVRPTANATEYVKTISSICKWKFKYPHMVLQQHQMVCRPFTIQQATMRTMFNWSILLH